MRNIILLFILSIQFTLAQEIESFELFYDSGSLKTKGQLIDGERAGEWKKYYETGELKIEFSYNNGKENIASKNYYKNGKIKFETIDLEGKRLVKRYLENGKLLYERITKVGYYKEYREDGTLKIKSYYENQELSGVWVRFYSNGAKEWEVEYNNGYKEGAYRQYYKNGQLKRQGSVFRNEKVGLEKRYLEDGKLEWTGKYIADKFSGKWKHYNAKGEKDKIIKYTKGKVSKGNSNLKETSIPNGQFETVPIYPGCEIMITNRELRKCFSNKVKQFISSKFNLKVAINDKSISGEQKIKVWFKIGKTGEYLDVSAKSPHKVLEEEAERLISLLPKVIPGEQRGEKVIVPFYLPIKFKVLN